MIRKIFRAGNSLVVSIPRDLLAEIGLAEGNDVIVELDRESRQIVLRPVASDLASGIDEKFAREVAEFIEEYRPALEALSKK